MTLSPLLAVLAILHASTAHVQAAQPSNAPSASTSAAPTPVPTPSAAGMRIATTLASEAVVRTTTGKVLRDQFPKAFAKDPNFQELERSFPGITTEFLNVLEPIIVAATIKRLPIYQAKVAALFDRRMNTVELDTTADFYASPAGRHVVALAVAGLDFGPILKRELESGGTADIASSEIRSAAAAAVVPAMKQLDPSELRVLAAFGATSAGQKVNQMRTELAELAAEENNRSDPAVEAEMAKAVEALIKQRVSAAAKK